MWILFYLTRNEALIFLNMHILFYVVQQAQLEEDDSG